MSGERSSDAKALSTTQIDDFEPKVLVALYETIYTFIVNILQDAQLYADHAHHKEILVSDVKLAIETRAGLDYTLPPSRDALAALAAKKNAIPLPLVQEKYGLRLPPERHLLIKQNISIVPKTREEVAESLAPTALHAPPPGLMHPSQTSVAHLQNQPSSYNPSPLSQPFLTAKPAAAPQHDDDYDME